MAVSGPDRLRKDDAKGVFYMTIKINQKGIVMKKQSIVTAVLMVLIMILSSCGKDTKPTVPSAQPGSSVTAASETGGNTPAQPGTTNPSSIAADPSGAAAVPETPAQSPENQPAESSPAQTESSPAQTESESAPTESSPEPTEIPTTEIPTTEIPPESVSDPTAVSEDYWDGTSQLRYLDESGRTVKVENYYPDGKLHFRKEFQYGHGTEIASEEFYEEWDKSGALIYSYRYENYADGSTKTSWLKYNDGTSNKSYYDEAHHDTGYETWYADGSQKSRTRKEYYPDSDVIASEVSEEWDESGRLTYSSTYTFHENGNTDRAEQLFEDGHRSVRLYEVGGKLLKTSEYYAGKDQLRYERSYEYAEDGTILRDVQQEWTEDGSLLAMNESVYYPDGSLKTSVSVPRWKNDTRYTYEYDEEGREIAAGAESMDGSYRMESTRVYSAEGVEITMTSFEHGETWQEIVHCDTEDRTIDHLWIREDGSTEFYLYDEHERVVSEEYKNADGFLTRTEKYEFFDDESSRHSYQYEAIWEEENNGYYVVEDWYAEEGGIWKDAIVYPDGSRFSSESNANGNTVVSDYWYANGNQRSHSEHEYFEDTGWRAAYSEQKWKEDGTEAYLSQETFYPNGWTKSYYTVSEGYIYHSEYDEYGNRTLYETGENGVITYRSKEEYSAEGGAKTYASEEYFNDDGSFSCRIEWELYPNDQTHIYRRTYDYGLESYREYYEDGRTRLVQEYYSNGTKRYEDVISEDGIEESTEWFENGAIKSHNVWNADGLQTLHETFQDNGNRYSLEIHRPDGTYTTRRYDGEGRVYYEDDYTSDTYYDRRFSEGRMFLERRTRRADDVYLGSTEWEYFEEGGVKKIRISENDENGVQISQTVIPDDGKTGYPNEL